MADEQTRPLPVAAAMAILRPNARWSLMSDDISTLVWDEDPADKPSDEEVIAKAEEILNNAPLRRLRQIRDDRMREVDWVTLRAARTGEPIPQEWLDYMQALADITDQAPNATLSGRDVLGVTWPERPDGKPAGNSRAARGLFGI